MLVFLLIFVIHAFYLIPDMKKTKQNEVFFRMMTQVPILFLSCALVALERNSYVFDVLINIAYSIKAVFGILLKMKMIKNGSNMGVNPIYLLPQGVGLLMMATFSAQNYFFCTLALIAQSMVVMVL